MSPSEARGSLQDLTMLLWKGFATFIHWVRAPPRKKDFEGPVQGRRRHGTLGVANADEVTRDILSLGRSFEYC